MRKKLISVLAALFILACPSAASAEGTATARIPATLSGNAGTEAVLRLESRDGGNEEEEITVKDGNTGYFTLPFGAPGTYRFSVTREEPGKKDGTVYGEGTYLVDVYVTEGDDGELSADPVIYLEGSKEKKDACHYTDTPREKESEKPSSGTGSVAEPVRTGDESPVAGLLAMLVSFLLAIGFGICRKAQRDFGNRQ